MNDCMEYRFKRVVVKVGSNVLTRTDGSLDIARMVEIVSQIAALRDAAGFAAQRRATFGKICDPRG